MDIIDAFDTGEEGAAQAAPNLQSLQRKIQEAIDLQAAADQMEEDLKAVKRNLHVIRTSVLPDMMAEIGVEKLVWNGWSVKIDDFVSGSLPSEPEKREKAIQWLEDHGAGGLIKTQLRLDFAKSQHNEALGLAEALRENGLAPQISSSVHPQTLQAYARERIRNGDDIDAELLGLFTGRVAKFTEGKKK